MDSQLRAGLFQHARHFARIPATCFLAVSDEDDDGFALGIMELLGGQLHGPGQRRFAARVDALHYSKKGFRRVARRRQAQRDAGAVVILPFAVDDQA